jgi:hypothetical protein
MFLIDFKAWITNEEKEAEKEKPFHSSMEIIQDYTSYSTIQGIDAHMGLWGVRGKGVIIKNTPRKMF